MRKSYLWSLALATVVVSGAVASSTLAPELTRADGEESEFNYVLDPEDGAIVNDLQMITISFPDSKAVQVNETLELNSIVLTNTETGEKYYCDSPLRDSRASQGIAYQLNFLTTSETEDGFESELKPITASGAYTLSILEGTFLSGEEVIGEDETVTFENVVPVPAINAEYTVVEALPEIAYVLDPEDGAIVNDLQMISISFPDSKAVQVNERIEVNSIVLTNIETGDEYYCDSPVRDTRASQGIAYQLNFLTTSETEDGFESELKPITAPGAYTLSILKGTFLSGEEVIGEDETVTFENVVPVPAINAEYTVVEALPEIAYVLDPEDGAFVNDLQMISISFPDNNAVQVNERMEVNSIVLTNIETGDEYYCDSPVRDARASQGISYQLNFLTTSETEDGFESELKPITAPGTYTLSILKGTFLSGEEVIGEDETVTFENVVPVQAINAEYTVVEALPEIAYVLDPEDGAIVNDLQTISISFPDNNAVQVNERMEFNSIVLTNIETGDEYYCDSPVRDARASQGISYQLNFLTTSETEDGFESELKPITAPGTYTLSILKGTFLSGEEVIGEDETVTFENVVPVQAINAVYTVVEALPEIAYVLDPEDGAFVSDLQMISLSFPDSKAVQVNERMEVNSIVLTNIETGEEYYCDSPVRDTRVEQGTAFTLYFMTTVETEDGFESTLEPITATGTYKLSILKGAFLCGDEVEDEDGNVTFENPVPVQEISATYIIRSTGVKSVFGADTTEFDVYGVNGIRILKAADSNAVNALPAGLYIINGKKVIKR